MLCCNELITPLNSDCVVVPGGENGFWFISSKPFVQDTVIARSAATKQPNLNNLYFITFIFYLLTII